MDDSAVQKIRHVAINLELDWMLGRHAGIFAGTQLYAQQYGWECVIDEFVADTLPNRRTQKLPYDGVIARATKDLAERAQLLGIPVVNVMYGSPVRDELPFVNVDQIACGRLRAEHLLDRGFHRFGCVIIQGDPAIDIQAKAFKETVEEAGYSSEIISVKRNYETKAKTWKAAGKKLDLWLDRIITPIGLFIAEERLARLVMQMCSLRGLHVPHDVAIIAGWNEQIICEHPAPGLTSLDPGYQRIGYEAARVLDSLMDGNPPPPEPILLPPVGIVARASTDFFAVDDEIVSTALRYIAANSRQHISVDDVAEGAMVSRRTLENKFRDLLKRSVASEIRRLRIERAKRLLVGTENSIAQIARETGFSEAPRLTESFRRELGMTPRDYRKTHARKPFA